MVFIQCVGFFAWNRAFLLYRTEFRRTSVLLTNVRANCDKAVIYIVSALSNAESERRGGNAIGRIAAARAEHRTMQPLKSADCSTIVRKAKVSRQLSWSGDCELCQSGCRSAEQSGPVPLRWRKIRPLRYEPQSCRLGNARDPLLFEIQMNSER